MVRVLIAVGLLSALSCAGPAQAHRTSLARLALDVAANGVAVELELSAHDLAVATGLTDDPKKPAPLAVLRAGLGEFRDYAHDRLSLITQAAACRAEDGEAELSGEGETVRLRFRFACGAAGPATLTYGLLFDIDSRHRVVGVLRYAGGEEEFVLDALANSLDFELTSGTGRGWLAGALELVRLGVEHILIGIDHVLFLLTLLFFTRGFWPTAGIVTAFTLAHSLTLALAWLGVIEPPAGLVEIAIALSIAYVALENILIGATGIRRRATVAALFGLIHGLGFYAVLSALALKGPGLLMTLFAFNLGVEIGQLAIVVAVFWPLLWWGRQGWHRRSAQILSAAVLAVALLWAAERALAAI